MELAEDRFRVTIVRKSNPSSDSALRSFAASLSLILLVGTVALVSISGRGPSSSQPLSLVENIVIRDNTLNDAIVNIASGKSNIVVQSRKHLPSAQGLPKSLPFKAEEPGIEAEDSDEAPVTNTTVVEESGAEEPAAEIPETTPQGVEQTPAPPAEGFVAKLYYFEQDLDAMPDVTSLTPNAEGVSKEISYTNHEEFKTVDPNLPDSRVAVSWSGLLFVEEAGPYTFNTASDDGSHVYIDGEMIVDNSGLHGVETKSGTVDLTAGYHEFYADFFEQQGGEHMVVTYSGPDTKAEEVLVQGFHEV